MKLLSLFAVVLLSFVASASEVISLSEQAQLQLPKGATFLDKEAAQKLLTSWGSGDEEPGLLGIILPDEGDEDWFAVVTFDASGYIKDDDAQNWDAQGLLESLKEGTKANNKNREALGLTPLEVIGWVQQPEYKPASHQLIWSVSAREEGNMDESDVGINYNTYVLGREGFINLNFVTSLALIESQKPIAHGLLDGISFKPGKTYGDFDASTDKVATYGLAALVAGVAAKKLGLVAVVLAFCAKFAKALIVGGTLALAAISKLISRFRRG